MVDSYYVSMFSNLVSNKSNIRQFKSIHCMSKKSCFSENDHI